MGSSFPRVVFSLCFSLSPSSFSCILFASDNFADRLSRFQQRNAVAYLSEKTGAKGRTLTVLFKFVRGRTKVLTVQRREDRRSRARLQDDFLSRIVACAAWRDENFSLEGQDAVTQLRGIPGEISRIIYRAGVASRERRRKVWSCTSRINDLANRAEKSKMAPGIIRAESRKYSSPANPTRELLIGQYFI